MLAVVLFLTIQESNIYNEIVSAVMTVADTEQTARLQEEGPEERNVRKHPLVYSFCLFGDFYIAPKLRNVGHLHFGIWSSALMDFQQM